MQCMQQKELETNTHIKKKNKNKLRFMSVHRHIKNEKNKNQTDTKGKIIQDTDSERVVFWPATVASSTGFAESLKPLKAEHK